MDVLAQDFARQSLIVSFLFCFFETMRLLIIALLSFVFGTAFADTASSTETKTAQASENTGRKPNLVWPIVGGALLGIGLAWWLRRKKNG